MIRVAACAVSLGLTALTLASATPLTGQVCLGTGLSKGGGAARAQAAAVSGAAVLGGVVFVDPVSPLGLLGQVDYATTDDGHGLHLGGRGVYQVGPPLGTTLCLTLGASFYQSEGRFRDFQGDRRTSRFRIYSPAAGLAIGFPRVHGALVINPYALAEGHLVFKQARLGDDAHRSSEWEEFANEARAVVELGAALQWRRFLVDAALLTYPGTHSVLEAFQATDEAGGSDAGVRLAVGVIF